MDWLRRLARDHALADQLDISVEELKQRRDHARTSGLDRRQILAGAVTALGVAALPKVARAGTTAPRIAIIGGGIAGLNAALTLSDAGYSSTVYEAAPRVGGRMHSNTTTWKNGQVSEWCGELIDTGHKTIKKLAKRFKLNLTDVLAGQPPGSDDTLFFFNQYYPNAQADTDFKPVHKILKAQQQSAPFPTLYNSYTQAGYDLDHTSAYDWIEQYVPGGHGSPLGAYIDSAYTNEYGRDTKEQSSLNIIYLLAFQPTPGQLAIYGASDERYHVDGGNDQIPLAIAAALPGPVKTNHKLTTIAKNGDGTYALVFATPNGTKTSTADRVIMTVPFSVLRGLDYSQAGFDELKTIAITELGYGTNSKLATQFTSRYWNTQGPWGLSDGTIYTDLAMQSGWETTRGLPGPQAVLAAFNGGSAGAAFNPPAPYTSASDTPITKHYAQQLMTQLEKIWPGVSADWNGLATLSTPWKDPNLLGSYSCWKVGQYTLFSGYEGVRQANCHFAGEHCSTNFQGFMEGGAEEGARAAGEILADYSAGIFP